MSVLTPLGGGLKVAIAPVHHPISRATPVSRWEFGCERKNNADSYVNMVDIGWQAGLLHPHLSQLEQSSMGQHQQRWFQLHGEHLIQEVFSELSSHPGDEL